MGFGWGDAEAAADAASGRIETALQLLTSGAIGGQAGSTWAGDATPGLPTPGPSADWYAPADANQPGWDWGGGSDSLKAQPSDWGQQYAAAPAVAAGAPAAADADAAWGAVPPPQERQLADDSEVDELMAMMLGVAC